MRRTHPWSGIHRTAFEIEAERGCLVSRARLRAHPAGLQSRTRSSGSASAIFDRAFGARTGRAAGDHYDLVSDDGDDGDYGLPTIVNPLHYEPAASPFAFRDRALRIAQTLLAPGGDAVVRARDPEGAAA